MSSCSTSQYDCLLEPFYAVHSSYTKAEHVQRRYDWCCGNTGTIRFSSQHTARIHRYCVRVTSSRAHSHSLVFECIGLPSQRCHVSHLTRHTACYLQLLLPC